MNRSNPESTKLFDSAEKKSRISQNILITRKFGFLEERTNNKHIYFKQGWGAGAGCFGSLEPEPEPLEEKNQ